MKRPYLLKKRGKYWYYRLDHEVNFHSTGKTTRNHAEEWILKHLWELGGNLRSVDITLGEYMDPFFHWDRCPHVARLREEGKSISEGYAKNQRRRKEIYICPDEIVHRKIYEVRRSDILDFRRRLIHNGTGGRTINMTIGILKIVFHEALFREDIDRDPTLGVGNIKYDKEETGIFTRQELIDLFAERPGVWRDLQDYTAFLLAAHCGLRRSEVVGLCWGQLNLSDGAILVDRAKTDNGLPKWNKIRSTLMTSKCVQALKELRATSEWVLPHHRVFVYRKGTPRVSRGGKNGSKRRWFGGDT